MHKRIAWLDAMKGFMIIFVVMCHSLVLDKNIGIPGHIDSAIMYTINIFIMPGFFAISGFLYKRVRSIHDYVMLCYKKVVGLAVPYLIISVILKYYMHSPNLLESILYQPIFLMWFLYALFFIFIIVGTLDLLHVPMAVQFTLYLIAMVAQTRLTWWKGPDYDMNPVACTLGYLTFFYVGYLVKHYYPSIKKLLSQKKVTFVLFVVLIIGVWLQAKYTGIFPYNTDQIALSDVVTKMLSVFAFFSLFMAFRSMNQTWLDTIGRSTLVVYLVHYFAVHSVFTWIMMSTMISSPILQSIIRFVFGLIFSVIMMRLVERVGVLKAVFYPRKYTDKWIMRK